jgi:hypothetical protein
MRNFCNLCEKTFFSWNTREIDQFILCKKHAKLYEDYEWYIDQIAYATPEDYSQSIQIYNRKKELWKKNVPSLIRTSYILKEDHIVSKIELLLAKKRS